MGFGGETLGSMALLGRRPVVRGVQATPAENDPALGLDHVMKSPLLTYRAACCGLRLLLSKAVGGDEPCDMKSPEEVLLRGPGDRLEGD